VAFLLRKKESGKAGGAAAPSLYGLGLYLIEDEGIAFKRR
jgi:hypothetical protein